MEKISIVQDFPFWPIIIFLGGCGILGITGWLVEKIYHCLLSLAYLSLAIPLLVLGLFLALIGLGCLFIHGDLS